MNQIKKDQLARQQLVLQCLGFYYGKLDGIWGPLSIDAKKRFESDKRFCPGLPNGGLPFSNRPPYPAGISIGHSDELLYHAAIAAQLKSSADPIVVLTPTPPKLYRDRQVVAAAQGNPVAPPDVE